MNDYEKAIAEQEGSHNRPDIPAESVACNRALAQYNYAQRALNLRPGDIYPIRSNCEIELTTNDEILSKYNDKLVIDIKDDVSDMLKPTYDPAPKPKAICKIQNGAADKYWNPDKSKGFWSTIKKILSWRIL